MKTIFYDTNKGEHLVFSDERGFSVKGLESISIKAYTNMKHKTEYYLSDNIEDTHSKQKCKKLLQERLSNIIESNAGKYEFINTGR